MHRIGRISGIAVFTVALTLFPSSIVEAHLVTTGLGPVYDGMGHLVLTVDDLIPVLALSLLAGLRGPKSARWTLFILPVAWFVGGLCGMRAVRETTLPFQCVSFLVLGVLVAADLKVPTVCVASLAVALGLAHGYADGSGIKDAGMRSGLLEFIGMMAAMFVVVALISALVVSLRRDWMRIVVRVAGSWIAAIGLLMLGWALHNSKPAVGASMGWTAHVQPVCCNYGGNVADQNDWRSPALRHGPIKSTVFSESHKRPLSDS